MPSYSEMAEIIGVRSKSVVHFWVAKLLDAGILQKDSKGFLSLTRNPRALKLGRRSLRGYSNLRGTGPAGNGFF